MEKIGIITDSTCDLTDQFIEEHQIEMLPARIIYNDAEYRDRVDISAQEIYDRFEDEIPKSSLPSPEDFFAAVERHRERGCDKIICIMLSAGLSGTLGMIRNMAREVEGIEIEVVDSRSLSLGLGYVVSDVACAIKEGLDFKKAIQFALDTVQRIRAFFVIKTLHYLRAGGRIGYVEGTIAEFLNIKPVITIGIEDGIYHTYKKIRGFKKAVKFMEKIVDEYEGDALRVGVMYGQAPDEAEKLKAEIEKNKRVKHIDIRQICPVLSVHTGPGLVGVIVQRMLPST